MKSVAIVLALALTVGAAVAQPADKSMMQKLNLTEEQQAQIRKLRVDFQKKEIQNEAKIKLARLDLGQMVQADKPDRSSIEKAIRDISSLQTDTKIARVDQMLAIRNILTPDQLKTWKEQRMNRRAMMRGRMGMNRRQGMGMLGENAPVPEVDMADMVAMPDPMDAPESMLDDLDLGGISAE
jgi:Spy/CpxP family protein refolding chaperone